MRNIKKNISIYAVALLLTFFATSASLGLLISVEFKLILRLLLIAILILFSINKPFINRWFVLPGIGMLSFYFLNNADWKNLGTIAILLLFPTMIYLVVRAPILDPAFVVTPLRAMKPVYMFYVLYTILMFFFRPLLDFAIKIFPTETKARLIFFYERGCMPGLTTHYSTNGMLIAMGIILFGCCMIFRKNKLNILGFTLCIIAVLLTGKRAHTIFTCAALYAAYFAYSADKKKGRVLKSIGVLLVAMVILLIVCKYIPALSTFVTRFIDTAEEGDVTLGRTEVWSIALDLFKSNPIIGIGWGQFTNQGYWLYDLHNIYIQLLCETGIIGFTFYLMWMIGFLVQTWRKLTRVRRNYNSYHAEDGYYLLISLSIQIFFLLYGLTGNPLYEPIMYIPYFLACAVSVIFPQRKKYRLNY